jgi:hypothetical protein
MAKRDSPTSRANKRRPAPVKKPFPVGFAIGCTVLASALIGLLVYAVINTGVGNKTSLKYAEKQISGVQSTQGLERNHRAGALPYPNQASVAPDGGNHNELPQSCQVYTAPVPNVNAVHSLEHGAVWAVYNPAKATKDDIAALTRLATGNPSRMVSPYPGLAATISLQAWGERLTVDSAKDTRVAKFFTLFTNGKQTQEAGATCVGNTTTVASPTDLAPGATAPTTTTTLPATPATPAKK